MKKITLVGAILKTIMLSAPARAEVNIEEIPTNWKLQNYIPGQIYVFSTGSSCAQGALTFPSTATADDKNRFFSLILTAKATGKRVGVYYQVVGAECQINSF